MSTYDYLLNVATTNCAYMVRIARSIRDGILEDIRIDLEKSQQALNNKRTKLRILPEEIAALEHRIENLKNIKDYLEKQGD